jgi:transposase-like protein
MGSSTGYQRRNRERWQALLAEQRDSGLTQSAFCRERGLALSTFQYWKRQLRDGPAGEADASGPRATSSEGPAFTEIMLPSSGAHAGGEAAPAEVELELGPGVRVTIRWASAC